MTVTATEELDRPGDSRALLDRLADWTVAPRTSEEPYTVLDAVVVGSLLITLLRHADRVTARDR